MSTEKQLSLWSTGIEESALMMEITDLKEKQNNLRRGLFQRYDLMQKEIIFLKEQIEDLKKQKEPQWI